MSSLKYAFFLAADIVLIGCTLHYIFKCLENPTQLVKLEQLQRPEAFMDYLGWAYFAAAWFGIGTSIYVAVGLLFSWNPFRPSAE
jgi:hypothetical protein